MWLRTRCELVYDIEEPTPFILMLRPRSGPQQWVAREEYRFTPWVPASEAIDAYGNLFQRLIAPPGSFKVTTQAEVKISDRTDVIPGAPFVEIPCLPDSVLNFLLPSRYCESDRFGTMAMEITANQIPGYDQVAAITDWLRRTIHYEPGLHDDLVSAVEVNLKQAGVCRDLSHLGIALCRSLSIPTRLVVGFLHGLKPMDLHAWFEAFIDGQWCKFDATQPGPVGGYVAIGFGRDAADVAVANQFGPAVFPKSQSVSVEQLLQPSD